MENWPNHTSKQPFITVAAKLFSKRTCLISEGHKGGKDVIMLKRLETKGPIVTCGAVNENEDISESSNQGAVSKSNIKVNYIEVLWVMPVNGFTAWVLGMVVYELRERGNTPSLMSLPSWEATMMWLYFLKIWQPVMQCSCSGVHTDFVSIAFGQSQGQTGGGVVQGWWICDNFFSFEIHSSFYCLFSRVVPSAAGGTVVPCCLVWPSCNTIA